MPTSLKIDRGSPYHFTPNSSYFVPCFVAVSFGCCANRISDTGRPHGHARTPPAQAPPPLPPQAGKPGRAAEHLQDERRGRHVGGRGREPGAGREPARFAGECGAEAGSERGAEDRRGNRGARVGAERQRGDGRTRTNGRGEAAGQRAERRERVVGGGRSTSTAAEGCAECVGVDLRVGSFGSIS